MHAREHLQPCGQLPRETRRARRRADDCDDVACADAARAGPPVAGKRARRVRGREVRAGADGALVELERLVRIAKICLRRERRDADLADRESGEHRGVAHVIARRDRREGEAERQSPRQQWFAHRDGFHREAMTLQHGVRQRARAGRQREHGARLEPPDRDRDIVAGRGQPGDSFEWERGGRHVTE